jgi:organic hydroperoxide reductase OsmC/OhrA
MLHRPFFYKRSLFSFASSEARHASIHLSRSEFATLSRFSLKLSSHIPQTMRSRTKESVTHAARHCMWLLTFLTQ